MSGSNAGGGQQEQGGSLMIRIASFIVDKRMLFFLIYILVIIFSLFSKNWVSVENDLAQYLSETTETKQGLELMEGEFVTYGSAKVMVANIPLDDALSVQEEIEDLPGVLSVDFTTKDTEQSEFVKHYNDGSALYNVTFRYDEDDDRALEALDSVRDLLSDRDLYISTSLGNQQAEIIENEMQRIILLVAVVVFVVLLLTSESYGEIPVLILTFVMSMVSSSLPACSSWGRANVTSLLRL